jgi:ABC-type dipeptide/oligopeptide/nickel transport system ATPase component
MLIRKAERKKAKLRLGIAGPSGSGKTWSALEIATGMGGKIGMIDTESGRGELYGNDFGYDIIRLEAPYSPERYIEAIKTFENAGYDILIIDSLSHAWVGDGGVLSIVDRAGSKSFTEGWRVATPKQNSLIDTLVNSKMHIITTFRVKTEYVTEKDDRGRMVPKKVGLAPVQRDGVEYEFTVFMDINQEHIAHVTKDNTKMFDNEWLKPSKQMGGKLMEWLNTGLGSTEVFKQRIMPEIIDAIRETESLEQLKEVYIKAYQQYAEEYPEDFKAIDAVKEDKKLEFADSKVSVTIPTNIPNTKLSEMAGALS